MQFLVDKEQLGIKDESKDKWLAYMDPISYCN